jgi:hypothetical protein
MKSMPIGENRKIGRLKASAIQKRLRMSRTMTCMSMPAPWPISCAMASLFSPPCALGLAIASAGFMPAIPE